MCLTKYYGACLNCRYTVKRTNVKTIHFCIQFHEKVSRIFLKYIEIKKRCFQKNKKLYFF